VVGVTEELLAVNKPGEDVIVYPVIGEPPVDKGATHDTKAEAIPGVAETDVGASGTENVVTELELPEETDEPFALSVLIINVYEVSSDRLDIVVEVVVFPVPSYLRALFKSYT
jgi:hypothetical protein